MKNHTLWTLQPISLVSWHQYPFAREPRQDNVSTYNIHSPSNQTTTTTTPTTKPDEESFSRPSRHDYLRRIYRFASPRYVELLILLLLTFTHQLETKKPNPSPANSPTTRCIAWNDDNFIAIATPQPLYFGSTNTYVQSQLYQFACH